MKLSSFAAPALALILPALGVLAEHQTATYNPSYDDPTTPTGTVACSDFFQNRGIYTLGQVPTFSNVGGFGGTSTCGQCYRLTSRSGATAYVTVVDNAGDGFVLSHAAFESLQPGVAGRIDVWSDQVHPYYCRL